jgi:hypothetical protein
LSDEFVKLEGLSLSLNKAIKSIGAESAGLRSLAAAGNASNRALEKAALSAASLEKRLIAIRAVSASPMSGGAGSILPPAVGAGAARMAVGGGGRPGAPGGGGGAGGGGRGGGVGGGFHGGNIHMGPKGIGLGTIGMAAGDWFWPLAATGAAIYGGKAIYESAKDLDTEKQRFRLLGLTESQNQEAFKFVRNLKVYGTSQVERMAAFREAQGVGREAGVSGSAALEFARLATPTLSKLDALGQGLDDESKSALHQSNISLLRFVEQSGGLKGPAEFNRLANIGYKLRQSSGGTVDFQKMLGVTQQGGVYTQNMTEEGWALAEPILQEVGGQAYGTGKMTAGQRLNNTMSRTPKNLIALAENLGLWTPTRHRLNDADAALFKASQEKFYIERMMPLYDKLHLSQGERDIDDAILFGRTGGKNVGRIQKALPAISKSVEAFHKAKDIDQGSDQLKASLSGQELEFQAAWTDFKTQFGTVMLPTFSGLLRTGSAVLRAAGEYPNVLKWLVSPAQSAWETLSGPLRDKSALSPPKPSGGNGTPVVLNMDGKRMATGLIPHFAKAAVAPQTGLTRYDDKLAMSPAGGL